MEDNNTILLDEHESRIQMCCFVFSMRPTDEDDATAKYENIGELFIYAIILYRNLQHLFSTKISFSKFCFQNKR